MLPICRSTLKQIDARPVGVSPEQVRANNGTKVYSSTLGYTIGNRQKCTGSKYGHPRNDDVTDAKILNYRVKADMRGGLLNDIRLAGLEMWKDGDKFDGIGFRFEEKTKKRPIIFGKAFGDVKEESKRTRQAWTTILFKNKPMAEKVLTSDEEWVQLGNKFGKSMERQDKDKQYYTYYWFDRA